MEGYSPYAQGSSRSAKRKLVYPVSQGAGIDVLRRMTGYKPKRWGTRMIGTKEEMKYDDFSVGSPTNFASTGHVQVLTIPQQGTAENQRVGRRIRIHKIMADIALRIGNAVAPTSTQDVCRVMFFVDRQCNGTSPTPAEVLESADYQSYMNMTNSRRFTILRDMFVTVNSAAGAYDGTGDQFACGVKHMRFVHNFVKPLTMTFDASAGAVTDLTSTSLNVLLIDSANGSGNYEIKGRIRFTD